MKSSILASLALALAVASLGWNITHRAPKLGYVETNVILGEFTEAIQARKTFELAKKEWESNLREANDSLAAAMTRMQKDFDGADQKGKIALRADFDRRNADLQRYTKAIQEKADLKDKELMDPVIRKVNSFLDLWGKQHGYSLLLGTMTGGNILQADPQLNLTAQILKDLNAQYKNLPESAPEKPARIDSTAK